MAVLEIVRAQGMLGKVVFTIEGERRPGCVGYAADVVAADEMLAERTAAAVLEANERLDVFTAMRDEDNNDELLVDSPKPGLVEILLLRDGVTRRLAGLSLKAADLTVDNVFDAAIQVFDAYEEARKDWWHEGADTVSHAVSLAVAEARAVGRSDGVAKIGRNA